MPLRINPVFLGIKFKYLQTVCNLTRAPLLLNKIFPINIRKIYAFVGLLWFFFQIREHLCLLFFPSSQIHRALQFF